MSIASGCILKNPNYPQSWPGVTIARGIEDRIEGKFACDGETEIPYVLGEPMGEAKNLSRYFLGPKHTVPCESVVIRRVSENEIEVQFIQAGSAAALHKYRRGKDYHVEGGWIAVPTDRTWDAEDIVMMYGSMTSYLSINTDGDLIVREKSITAGTILVVIPVGGATTQWAKFKRKE